LSRQLALARISHQKPLRSYEKREDKKPLKMAEKRPKTGELLRFSGKKRPIWPNLFRLVFAFLIL
jgi:hypothetical protein